LFERDLFGKPVSTFPDHALGFGYCSQPELQAINERGWLLTKAAEPATSKPKTTVNARNFIIVQIESPWIQDLNLRVVGGGNESGYGQQYGVPVARRWPRSAARAYLPARAAAHAATSRVVRLKC